MSKPDPASSSPAFALRLGRFVRFSHTLFALPFALISFLVASEGTLRASVLGWILLCMVGARTAAMCFNRLADWNFDQLNPRTSDRHRLVTKAQALTVLLLSSLLAIYSAAQLNPLCFWLSPLMLAVLFFYSLTKRFTAFSHLVLGVALAIAPIGAWIALRPSLFDSPIPYLLAAAVACWTFGFDLIYSTLDVAFDRSQGLYSFPSRYGIPAALRLARALHILAALGFGLFGWVAHLRTGYWVAFAVCVCALVWEHRLAASQEVGQINRAFFQINALVSLTLFAGVLSGFLF